MRTRSPGQLTGVTAFSPTNVWVFGGPGANPGLGTWHLTGGTWTHVTGLASGVVKASALSPTSMWAIGSVSSPEDAIVHYNGTSWQHVTSPALSGLQFDSILALSASNIWATASVGGRGRKLVHFNGHTWKAITIGVTSSLQLARIATDGSGGLWFTALALSSNAWYAVHRSAAGAWTSHKLISGGGGGVFDLAHIPGTASLWAPAATATATGADATVWGFGPAA